MQIQRRIKTLKRHTPQQQQPLQQAQDPKLQPGNFHEEYPVRDIGGYLFPLVPVLKPETY